MAIAPSILNPQSSPMLSPTEPVNQLRHVPIVECGEPLVDFLEACPALLLDKPRFPYRRETLARRSLAEKLCQAAANVPAGYRLAVLECWRPPHIQKRMHTGVKLRLRARYPEWSETKLARMTNTLSAPLSKKVPPPHSTGGAVDLWLCDAQGNRLDHSSPFEILDPRCYAFNAPGLSDTATRHRRILWDALIATGLTNYPSEYWHWSYGDQGWAYRGEHPHALYSAITPDGYEPEPGDVSEEPLQFIEQ